MTSRAGDLATLFKIGNHMEMPGRVKAELVTLPDSDSVTFDVADGNIAIWERNGITTNSTLTINNSAGTNIDGMGFMIMAHNNDTNDSDRELTLVAGGNQTIDFSGDSATFTWSGGKKTVLSGLVFDSDSLILTTVTTDKVIT